MAWASPPGGDAWGSSRAAGRELPTLQALLNLGAFRQRGAARGWRRGGRGEEELAGARGGTSPAAGAGWDTLQECLPAPATASSLPQHPATHPQHPRKGARGPPLLSPASSRRPLEGQHHTHSAASGNPTPPHRAPQQAQGPRNGPGWGTGHPLPPADLPRGVWGGKRPCQPSRLCFTRGTDSRPPAPLCWRGHLAAPPVLLLPKATSLQEKEAKYHIRAKP